MSINSALSSVMYSFVSILVNNKNRLSLVVILLFACLNYANSSTYAYLSKLRNNPQDAFIIDKLTQNFKLNR